MRRCPVRRGGGMSEKGSRKIPRTRENVMKHKTKIKKKKEEEMSERDSKCRNQLVDVSIPL
jgi:hypothetical protein